MAKKFSELRAKMPEGAQARAAARADAFIIEMHLRELRKTRQVTQIELMVPHGVVYEEFAGIGV